MITIEEEVELKMRRAENADMRNQLAILVRYSQLLSDGLQAPLAAEMRGRTWRN
jgi:hypothetical protein